MESTESQTDTLSATPDRPYEAISRRKYAVLVGTIIGVALILRVAMLFEFSNSNPIAKSVAGDAGVYWEAAGQIADGQWIDDRPFLSVPLYPYVLAIVRVLSSGLTAVYVVQLLIHLITAYLVAYLSARKFDRATGALAAVLFLILEEPAFLSTRLLPSTLQLLLVTVGLLAAERFCRKGRINSAVLVGFSLGLLSLVYPPTIALVLLLIPWMWLRTLKAAPPQEGSEQQPALVNAQPTANTHARSRGLTCGVVACLAGCVVVLPATLHNWAACGELIPITAHAGITFRQGNAPAANGTYIGVPGVSAFRKHMHDDAARVYATQVGRQGTYREVDRFFFSEGLTFLGSHPQQAAWLIVRKVHWFLTGRHYSDIYHPTLERSTGLARLLILAPIPTAWLMGPMLVGLINHRVRHRLNAVDWGMLLLPILIVATFWYSPRYRLPLLPIACVLTAGVIVQAIRGVFRDTHGRGKVAFLLVMLCLSMATGPINSAMKIDVAESYRAPFEFNRGQVYSRIGEHETALEHFRVAEELAPGQPLAVETLTRTYLQLNRLTEAEAACDRLHKLTPDSPLPWVLRGRVYLGRNQWGEAEDAFMRGLAIDPDYPEAHEGLWYTATEYGVWQITQGNLDEAEFHLRRALHHAPNSPDAHYNLGAVLLSAGNSAEAVALFERTLQLDPTHAKAKEELARLSQRKPAQSGQSQGQP
ncbi:MAG: tetratricopeptide repeat protein [Phycisphaerales bacterium]|nr:MAG: tetratricopeptide repeat protein [Phycisphaerales bacterium]